MAVIIEDAPIISSEQNKINYPTISSLMGRVGLNVTTRALQSDNFVTGASGAGWQLTAEGNLEATSGTFRGALAATSGTIGGFTIGATTLSDSGNTIKIDSSNTIIRAGIDGGTRVELSGSENAVVFYDVDGIRSGDIKGQTITTLGGITISAKTGATTRFWHFTAEHFFCQWGLRFGDLTFTNLDTTPSVKLSAFFREANTSATTITQFDDGLDSTFFRILFTTANTTIQNNANIKLAGGVDFVGSANDILALIRDPSSEVWYEVSRSVN